MASCPIRASRGQVKKLVEAGYYWATSSKDQGEIDDDNWIVDEAKVEDVFILEHSNWPAYELFLDCSTQWRVISGFEQPQFQGLDYTSLESVMRMNKVKSTRKMLESVRAVERGALAGLKGMRLEQLFGA